MKTLINQVVKKSIWVFAFLLILGACKNDDGPLVIEEAFEEGEFAESPIISFEEIDEMTKSVIDGELNDESSAKSSDKESTNRGGISIERRRYDFNATVTRGADAGTELSGELNVKFTLYHASFAIIRGFLDLGNGDRATLRGAWISDGFVYLIMRLPDNSLVFGYGVADDEGDIQGRFRFFTRNGRSVGDWTAELTSVTTPDQDLVDIIAADGRFETLVAAATQAELVGALKGEGPLTLFAPTDDAFAALDAIPEGETLKQVLLYHVLDGKFRTQKLLRKEMLTTLQGEDIKVTLNENNELIINDVVKLVQANIRAKNGILHVIEAVLIPPSLQDLPSIVDIATGDENFSTLVSALSSADLVETLQGDGPFTVFAPTNAAFEKLEAIPEGEALKEVLLYHVAAGKLTAADIVEAGTVVTLNDGAEITVEMIDDKVILNGTIEVAVANIMASNGIVHVINDVLIPPLPSIVDIATSDDNFSTLVGALASADLVETLQGEGPFTVFAPTNDAFDKLDAIPGGEALKDILLYHVAAGKFDAATLLADGKVKTIQGAEITVEKIGDDVILNGMVKVVAADIMASNGIVHVIDTVLIPQLPSIVEIATGDDNFSTLVTALASADLVETLQGEGPFTVFAPTNDAFAKLDALPEGDALKDVLLYHVAAGKFDAATLLADGKVTTIQGTDVTVEKVGDDVILNGMVKVVIADIMASNGIVHVIDTVLIPTLPSIVDIATGDENFSTLVSALSSADLVETLQGDGPFTVFAPTNDAFAKLNALPEGDALKQVLLYHVASGKFDAATLLADGKVTTIQGDEVTVEKVGDDVILNGTVKVVVADIMASNGIVHVIDTVLIPPVPSIVDIVVENDDFSTLEALVIQQGLVDTLNGDGPFTVFAPTDAAFAMLNEVPQGQDLTNVLLYHVLSGTFTLNDIPEGVTMIATALGEELKIDRNGNMITLNDTITVTTTDIMASNGVIHVIDGVLIPPSLQPLPTIVEIAAGNPDFSTLVSAVQQAGLVDALNAEGPFTVFAPTNTAFAQLDAIPEGDALAQVLLYHVIDGKITSDDIPQGETLVTTKQGEQVSVVRNGDMITLNETISVIVKDIMASNGVIHVIDGVLIPPSFAGKTILDLAKETPELSTLVSAVESAGLDGVLDGEGDFTVFAPTNDAFAQLAELPEGDALVEVLKYHVVGERLFADDLKQLHTVTTLQGQDVTIFYNNGKIYLNGHVIQVAIADIEATNGVVHVITGVLIPPASH
ncbi:fasciclin domain-containing protein [Spongiivirga sp. MCCC 1A20706]|uniref:fasciclin domain-containing protein n=1 Tax=Spongiivirga sp. MCCC 1A20706 TaxID=3160963 RepID=UPI00397745AA